LFNLKSLFASFKTPSIKELKRGSIPNHVAIIMDGNGRWAEKKHLPRVLGHQKGAEVLREIIIAARDIGVKYLTAFSFSSENWSRPANEVNELMQLFVEVLKREMAGLMKNDVKLNLIGQRSTIPGNILEIFEKSESKTKHNKTLILNIAFNYGSRQEIVDAVEKILDLKDRDKISNNKFKKFKDLDNNVFNDFLYTAGIPDPDLLIRTSGEYRLSNFLLWQIAYTELYFTKILWPDFNRKYFFCAIKDFQQRNRRFGRV
jgi:undecaprenyl diphosphate synthase